MCDCGDSECRYCGTAQGTREVEYVAPSWKELPAIFAMMDAWEKRLCASVHDNQKCKGLWLKLYGDGSGSIMGEFADAPEEGDSELEQIRKVVFMEPTSVFDFDTLDELHGYLVCKTMSVKKGSVDAVWPTREAMEKAREIVTAWCHDDKNLELTTEHDCENKGARDMMRRIALALDAARRVPDGHVREGVTDRKVLGTLPKTADGCVVGHGAVVYHPLAEGASYELQDMPFFDVAGLDCDGAEVCGSFPVSECYISESAAKSAMENSDE